MARRGEAEKSKQPRGKAGRGQPVPGFVAEEDLPMSTIGGGHGSLVRDGVRVFYKSLGRRLIRHGIGVPQWLMLRALWEQDGQTQVELSRRLSIESAGLTAKLDVMEREGLIERRRNPDDRRKINVFLTRRAWKMREALFACALEVNEIAERGLDPKDIEIAHRTIRAMMRNIKEADAEAKTPPVESVSARKRKLERA